MKKMSLITLVLASVISTQVAAEETAIQNQQNQQNQQNNQRQMLQQKMNNRFQSGPGNNAQAPASGDGMNPETGTAPGAETPTPVTTSPTMP